jgi:hypothetical protein
MRSAAWPLVILAATLLCVAMLFAPLVREIMMPLPDIP